MSLRTPFLCLVGGTLAPMYRIAKYIGTGCVGLVVNLGTLHLLVDVVGMHYLSSSIVAVSCSTIVGFLLQKYWTFAERSGKRTIVQFGMYVFVALANIGINTALVYVLVEWMSLHHLAAQFIGAGAVAVSSFLLYRYLIFTMPATTQHP